MESSGHKVFTDNYFSSFQLFRSKYVGSMALNLKRGISHIWLMESSESKTKWKFINILNGITQSYIIEVLLKCSGLCVGALYQCVPLLFQC